MDTNSQSSTGISTSIAVVVLVFFLALLGSLPLLSRYHLDEGWYTNAAIQMVQSGDYVTPRYADGTLRFRKPILTYWVLVTSYAALGISFFSSRLPFLLAACTILWVTYRLARSVTQDESTNVLSAALLGSNIQFMESATKRPRISCNVCFSPSASGERSSCSSTGGGSPSSTPSCIWEPA